MSGPMARRRPPKRRYAARTPSGTSWRAPSSPSPWPSMLRADSAEVDRAKQTSDVIITDTLAEKERSLIDANGVDLSDHPAISGRFAWSVTTPSVSHQVRFDDGLAARPLAASAVSFRSMSTIRQPEDSTPSILRILGAASTLVRFTSALSLIVVASHEVFLLVFSDSLPPNLAENTWFSTSLFAVVASNLLSLILTSWRARIARGEFGQAKTRLERIQAVRGEAERAAEVSEEDDREKLLKLLRAGHVDQVRALCEALSLPLDFSSADLSGADLSGIDLRGADLSSATLSEAQLSGAILDNATLNNANLSRVSLSGADLPNFHIVSINLRNSDLSGADLSGAVLNNATLDGADLSGANLSAADLRGALFREVPYPCDANLSEVILSEAHYDSQTMWPEGFAHKTSGALTTWAKTLSALDAAIERQVCRTEDNKRFFIVPTLAQILDGPDRVFYTLKNGETNSLHVRLSELDPYEVSKRHAQRHTWIIA